MSRAAISLLFGAAQFEGGVFGPIIGYLIDRFGPRALILIGTSLAGIGLILVSTVHSFLAFFIIYILLVSVGYNTGFFHPVSTAINSWFIRRRGLCFAITSAAGCVGGMAMAPLLSYIIMNFGWRLGAIIAGLIIFTVCLPAALPIYRSPEVRGLYPDGWPPQENHTDESNSVSQRAMGIEGFTVKEALRTLSYWLLALSISLRILVTIALMAHIVPILVWKGMSEATSAYLVSLFTFSSIVTTLVMGWMGDRWNKTLLCSAGILPTVLVMYGLVLSKSIVTLIAFPIGLAITMGTASLNWALIGDFFGRIDMLHFEESWGLVME